MGAGQRRRGAMLSIQSKNQLKTGSFLMCWLAGPFCQNLLFSTNDLEDVANRKGRWGILFWGGGILFKFEQPKIWKMGADQRRRSAMLSIQSKNRVKTCF
jgi:hypothetical protein